jgi:hypothetical protein
MKAYGGVDAQSHIFLTSALVGVVSFTPLPLYLRERAPGTHWIGGWVGPRAGLDDVEKRKFLSLPGLLLRPLGRPARSQSLYRLCIRVRNWNKWPERKLGYRAICGGGGVGSSVSPVNPHSTNCSTFIKRPTIDAILSILRAPLNDKFRAYRCTAVKELSLN